MMAILESGALVMGVLERAEARSSRVMYWREERVIVDILVDVVVAVVILVSDEAW